MARIRERHGFFELLESLRTRRDGILVTFRVEHKGNAVIDSQGALHLCFALLTHHTSCELVKGFTAVLTGEERLPDVEQHERNPAFGRFIAVGAGACAQVGQRIVQVRHNRRNMPQQFRGGEAEQIGFRIGERVHVLRHLHVVREVRRKISRYHRDGERRKRTVCRFADVVADVRYLSQRVHECLARRVADRLENDHAAGCRQRIDRQGSVLEAEGEHALERCIRRAEQVYRMKMFVDALANGRRLRVRQHKVKEERRKILHVRSGPDRGEECSLEDRKRERVIFEQRKEPLFIEIAQLLRDLHVIVDVVEKLV